MRDRIPREEIEKWLRKIKKEMKDVVGKAEFIKNIKAYVSDCEHWLEQGDYVLAFESVIWSWAWLEIGKELKILEKNTS